MSFAFSVRKPKSTSRRTSGNLGEFGVALYIFLLLIAFPLIDLFGVAVGAGIILLGAHQASSSASTQRRYTDCLASMQAEMQQFTQSPFAKFIKLKPVGGYGGSGADLYIDVSNIVGANATTEVGPNTPLPPPIDTSANVYECTVRMHSEVGPLMNMSFVPFIGSIPGLGQPADLTLSASRAAEYPRALESPVGTLASANTTVPPFSSAPTAGANVGLDGSGWNNPNIYEVIRNAGQTIVSEEVVIVRADNPNWTPTWLNVTAGERLYVDTRADGQWTTAPWQSVVNANGISSSLVNNGRFNNLPSASLAGIVGSSGSPFVVGVNKLNMPLTGSGPLQLSIVDNSDYTDNSGVMMVRVIVVQ